jgi:hypothetical protein
MLPLRVVVIGSGPGGLTTLKTLLCQPEFDPICIEGEFGSGPLLFSFSPLPWTIILQLHTRIRSWRLAVKRQNQILTIQSSERSTDYSTISTFDRTSPMKPLHLSVGLSLSATTKTDRLFPPSSSLLSRISDSKWKATIPLWKIMSNISRITVTNSISQEIRAQSGKEVISRSRVECDSTPR